MAWFLPYVLFADRWTQWRDAFPEGRGGGVPRSLADSAEQIWILQRNHYGVCTLLEAPGRIVLADAAGRARVLDASPEEWLARELEGGTRQQPSTAVVPGGPR